MPNSNNNSKKDRFEELLDQYLDGMLDPDKFIEFEQCLMDDEANRERYLEKAAIAGGLAHWAIEDNSKQINLEHLRHLVDKKRPEHSGFPTILTKLPHAIWVTFGLLIGVGLIYFIGQFSGDPAPKLVEKPRVESEKTESLYAARISMASDDVQWGNEQRPDFLMRLKKQEFVNVSHGKVMVEFVSGARLALFGPAKLKILDVDAARLESGRTRGFADGSIFRLETPSAEIIDLGTEFGVSIDNSANVHVSLFKGSVDVRPAVPKRSNANLPNLSVILDVEGTGATVKSDGSIQKTKTDDDAEFEWSIDQTDAENPLRKIISLVDVVAGGDGLQRRIAGAINPITGEIDRRPTPKILGGRYRQDSHPGEFKRNYSSKFLDGAFITRRRSYSIVNSRGDTFEFNLNEGRTLGPIWSRSNAGYHIQTEATNDFWGTRTLPPIIEALEKSNVGVLGIHPNAGITIDLEALRKHHGRSLTNFSAKLKNLDNSMEVVSFGNRINTANFRVIVDGKLRFEKLGFTKSDGEIDIEVELGASDRFLTLVSTDAGDSTNFDRVVVIDPILSSK